jgi:integrase/recombinase XerD
MLALPHVNKSGELDELRSISAVSPEVALRKPMADLVLAALQSAGRSEHTRRAYLTAIGLFLQFLDQERGDLLPPALADEWRPFSLPRREGRRTIWEYHCQAAVLRLVDASLLDAFRSWREGQGDGPNAVTTRVYAVRSFLRVAYRDGILTQDQAAAMGLKVYQQRQKRDELPVGRRLSMAEAKALRAAPDLSSTKGVRDLLILDMMLYGGLRREEVVRLKLENFHQDGGRLWIVLSGKGAKTRRIKVHDALYKSLLGWLGVIQKPIGGEGYLFTGVNKAGKVGSCPLDASVIGRLVAEYGCAAGIAPLAGSNRLSPHDLRRTCARNAYDNGASLLLVQAMLGHSDPKTTARYIGAYDQDDNTAVDYVRYG